jgi:hypothetical protein
VTAEGLNVDIMLDSVENDESIASIITQRHEIQYDIVFLGTEYKHMTTVSPYLFRCSAFVNDILDSLLSTGNRQFFLGITGSDFSTAKNHWKNLLTVKMQDGKNTHFRFYGNSILHKILSVSSEGEKYLLMGPYQYLLFFELFDAVSYFMHSDSRDILRTRLPKDTKELKEKFLLRDEHYAPFSYSLDEIFVSNLENLAWRTVNDEAYSIYTIHGDIKKFIKNLLVHAQKCDIRSERDITQFIIASLYSYARYSSYLSEEIIESIRRGIYTIDSILKFVAEEFRYGRK